MSDKIRKKWTEMRRCQMWRSNHHASALFWLVVALVCSQFANFHRFYQSQNALGSLPMQYHCWAPFNFSVGCIRMEVHQRISFYVHFFFIANIKQFDLQATKSCFSFTFFSIHLRAFFHTFSLAISPRRAINNVLKWGGKSQRCSFFNSKTFTFPCFHPRILICTSNECCCCCCCST